MSRTFTAHSALGEQLQFRSFSGYERMGHLFEFQVRLLSDAQGISAKALLGTDMTIEVDLTTKLNGGGKRYLSGMVTSFALVGRDGDSYAYEAMLRPWLWLASLRTDFKIFQNKTVPDIVKEVLAPYGFTVDDKLCNSYRTWEYCVQYGESDFNFISRLLEHEGAYYYFAHQMGSHSMVLADDIGSHSPLPNGPTTIPYYPSTRAAQVRDEDYIDDWLAVEDIASGRFAADDYDFTKPRALLDTHQAQPGGYSQDSWEVFNWPGGYTEMGDGQNYARVRIEQLEALRESVQGQGNARNLAPGYNFTLNKYPDAQYNKSYLIEATHYDFTENVERSDGGGSDSATTYRIDLNAVPASARYRVAQRTPKMRSQGPQTATVVGPAGEEIWTDEYGRVKVQFQWDRYGKNDENSSCWIRVSQSWAGANYGTMHIPRIGQEVIVEFLNGDPDYPIITGRVYNADQMPPWDLPANKTQSGIKTRSSKNGTPGDGLRNSPGMANALRFEDKAGQEQLWLHAQKDQLTEVEHDEDKWVGNDRRKTIDGNEINIVHKNRTETVDLDETITVHQNRVETVDLNETITVHQNRTETVDLDETVSIGKNRQHATGLNSDTSVGVDDSTTVGSNQNLSVGSDRTKSVGSSETDSIGSNWTINVGALEIENIGAVFLQNVGAVKMLNTGAIYNENVGGAMITSVGFYQSTTVGADRTVSVGANQTTTIGATNAVTVGSAHNVTAGNAVNVVAPVINITGGSMIKLSVGNSVIVITEGGIQILSPVDRLNC